MDLIREEKPDVVILLMTERSLHALLWFPTEAGRFTTIKYWSLLHWIQVDRGLAARSRPNSRLSTQHR